MTENVVNDYGWADASVPENVGYLAGPVIAALNRAGAKRVLDLGCGNGSLCGHLRTAGFEVVGVEYDAAGVAIAQRTFPHINFYNFGVQDNPSALLSQEAQFDAVVSTEVVEHLFSPHLLPQYAHPLLRENGTLVVTTPYHGYVKNLALAVLGKWDHHHHALWHGGHIKFFSRRTLTQLLERNCFRVTGFSGVGRAPLLWKSMILEAKKIG